MAERLKDEELAKAVVSVDDAATDGGADKVAADNRLADNSGYPGKPPVLPEELDAGGWPAGPMNSGAANPGPESADGYTGRGGFESPFDREPDFGDPYGGGDPYNGVDPASLAPPPGELAGPELTGVAVEQVVEALRTVYDPEIPVNLYDLGLIYDIREGPDGTGVRICMTLTTPGCPVAGSMPGMVERAVSAVDGLDDVRVYLVWDPPWSMEMMSAAARIQLGM